MARNGSGTFSIPNTFVSGNTITASGHNQNNSDIASEITNSVAADGQTSMTGPLKAANGTNASPTFTFASDTDTGGYRSGANEYSVAAGGTQITKVSSAGLDIKSGTLLFNGVSVTYPFVAEDLASNSVTTAKITDANVTLAKIADFTSGAFLVRYTNSTGVPQLGSFGTGLSLNTSTGVLTAPAFPPTALFKKLSILVASNTTVTVAADFVVTSDGTNYQSTAVSSTINLGTTGADALDTGTIAIDTWYAIWVVAKSDGTTKCVASTSASSPTMPSGYTYKARVGWVKTIHGSATLYGTYQVGRRAQYIVGLAQTTTAVVIGTTSGTSYNTFSVNGGNVQQSFVPPTASEIFVSGVQSLSTGDLLIAPNSGYAATITNTNTAPIAGGRNAVGAVGNGSLLLENTNIYACAPVAGAVTVFCNGWVDNI